MRFSFIRAPKRAPARLEIYPTQQIQRVVVRGVAPEAVVVIASPVEFAVANVLQLQLRVQPGQIVDLGDVAARVGFVRGASLIRDRNRGWVRRVRSRVPGRVRAAGGVEQSQGS